MLSRSLLTSCSDRMVVVQNALKWHVATLTAARCFSTTKTDHNEHNCPHQSHRNTSPAGSSVSGTKRTTTGSGRFQHRRFTPKRARTTVGELTEMEAASENKSHVLLRDEDPRQGPKHIGEAPRPSSHGLSFSATLSSSGDARHPVSDTDCSATTRTTIGSHTTASRVDEAEEFRLISGLPLPPGSPLPFRSPTITTTSSTTVKGTVSTFPAVASKEEALRTAAADKSSPPPSWSHDENHEASPTGKQQTASYSPAGTPPHLQYTEVSSAAICSYLLTLQRVYRMSGRHLMTQRAATEAALTYLREILPSQVVFQSPNESCRISPNDPVEKQEQDGGRMSPLPPNACDGGGGGVLWDARIAVSVIRTASVFSLPLAMLPVVQTAADTLLELLRPSSPSTSLYTASNNNNNNDNNAASTATERTEHVWKSVGKPLDVAQLTMLVHRLVQREQMNRHIAREIFMNPDETGQRLEEAEHKATLATATATSTSAKPVPARSIALPSWHDQFEEDVSTAKERSLLLFYSAAEAPSEAEHKLHCLYIQVLLPRLMAELHRLLSDRNRDLNLPTTYGPSNNNSNNNNIHHHHHDHLAHHLHRTEADIGVSSNEPPPPQRDAVFNREELEVFSTTLSVLQKALASHLVVSSRGDLASSPQQHQGGGGGFVVFSDGVVSSPAVEKLPFYLFSQGMRCSRRAVDSLFTSAIQRPALSQCSASSSSSSSSLASRPSRFTSRRVSSSKEMLSCTSSTPTDKLLFQDQIMPSTNNQFCAQENNEDAHANTTSAAGAAAAAKRTEADSGIPSGRIGRRTGAQNVNIDILHPILLFSTNTSALDLLFYHRDSAVPGPTGSRSETEGDARCGGGGATHTTGTLKMSHNAAWSSLQEDVLVLLRWGFDCIPFSRTKHLAAFASSYSRLLQPLMTAAAAGDTRNPKPEANATTGAARRFPLASARFALQVARVLAHGSPVGLSVDYQDSAESTGSSSESIMRCTPHMVLQALCQRALQVTNFFSSSDTAAFLKALNSIMQCWRMTALSARITGGVPTLDVMTTALKKRMTETNSNTTREHHLCCDDEDWNALEVLVTTTVHEIVKQLDSDGYSPLRVPSLIFVMRRSDGVMTPSPALSTSSSASIEPQMEREKQVGNVGSALVTGDSGREIQFDAISKRVSRYVAKKAGHASLYTQAVLTVDEFLSIHKALTQLCPLLPDIWLRLVGRLLYDYYFRLSEPEKARTLLGALYDHPFHGLHFGHREGTSLTLELAVEHYMCFMTFSGRTATFYPPQWAIEAIQEKMTRRKTPPISRPSAAYLENTKAIDGPSESTAAPIPAPVVAEEEAGVQNMTEKTRSVVVDRRLSVLQSIFCFTLKVISEVDNAFSDASTRQYNNDQHKIMIDRFLEHHNMKHRDDAALLQWMREEMASLQGGLRPGEGSTERNGSAPRYSNPSNSSLSLMEESRLQPTLRLQHVVSLLLRSVRFVPSNYAEGAERLVRLSSRSELLEEMRILDACGIFFELISSHWMVAGADCRQDSEPSSCESFSSVNNDLTDRIKQTCTGTCSTNFSHQLLNVIKAHKTILITLCLLSRWALLQLLLARRNAAARDNEGLQLAFGGSFSGAVKRTHTLTQDPMEDIVQLFSLSKDSSNLGQIKKMTTGGTFEAKSDNTTTVLQQQYMYCRSLTGLLKVLMTSRGDDDLPLCCSDCSGASTTPITPDLMPINEHTILSLGNVFYQTQCLETEIFEAIHSIHIDHHHTMKDITSRSSLSEDSMNVPEKENVSKQKQQEALLFRAEFSTVLEVALGSLATEFAIPRHGGTPDVPITATTSTTTSTLIEGRSDTNYAFSSPPHLLASGWESSATSSFFSLPTTFALHTLEVQDRVARMSRVPLWLLQRLYPRPSQRTLSWSHVNTTLLSRWAQLPVMVSLEPMEEDEADSAAIHRPPTPSTSSSTCAAAAAAAANGATVENALSSSLKVQDSFLTNDEGDAFYKDYSHSGEKGHDTNFNKGTSLCGEDALILGAPYCTVPTSLQSLGLLNTLLKQWVTAWVACPPARRRRPAVFSSLITCLLGEASRTAAAINTNVNNDYDADHENSERAYESRFPSPYHLTSSSSSSSCGGAAAPALVTAFLRCLEDHTYSEEDVVVYFGVLLECVALLRQQLEELQEGLAKVKEKARTQLLPSALSMENLVHQHQAAVSELESVLVRSIEGLQRFQESQYGPGCSFCDGQSIFSSSSFKSMAFLLAGVARLPPPPEASGSFTTPLSRHRSGARRHACCEPNLFMDVIVEPYLRATSEAVADIARRQQEQRYDVSATMAIGGGSRSGRRVLVGVPPVELLQYLAMLKPSLLPLVLNTQTHGNQRRFRRAMRGDGGSDSDTTAAAMLTPLDCLLHVLLTLEDQSSPLTSLAATADGLGLEEGEENRGLGSIPGSSIANRAASLIEDQQTRMSLSFTSVEEDDTSCTVGRAENDKMLREREDSNSVAARLQTATIAAIGSAGLLRLGQFVAKGVERQQHQNSDESDPDGPQSFWRSTSSRRVPWFSVNSIRLRVTDEQEEMSNFLKDGVGSRSAGNHAQGILDPPIQVLPTALTDSVSLPNTPTPTINQSHENNKKDRWWSPQRQRSRLVGSITQLLQQSQELSRVTPQTIGRLSLVLDSPRVVALNKNLKYRISQLLFHTFLKRGTGIMGAAVTIPVHCISFMPSSFQKVLYSSPIGVLQHEHIDPSTNDSLREQRQRSSPPSLVALPESMVRVFPYISLSTWRELLCGPRPLSLFWFSVYRQEWATPKGRRGGTGPAGLGGTRTASTSPSAHATTRSSQQRQSQMPKLHCTSSTVDTSSPPPGYHSRPPRYPMDPTAIRNLKFHHSGFMFLAFLTPSQLFALRDSLGPLSFLQLGRDFLLYYVSTWIGVERCAAGDGDSLGEDMALSDVHRMAERTHLEYLIESWGVEEHADNTVSAARGRLALRRHQKIENAYTDSHPTRTSRMTSSFASSRADTQAEVKEGKATFVGMDTRRVSTTESEGSNHLSCPTSAVAVGLHEKTMMKNQTKPDDGTVSGNVSRAPAFIFSRHPRRAAPFWMVYHQKANQFHSSSSSFTVNTIRPDSHSIGVNVQDCRGVDLWYAVLLEMLCDLVMRPSACSSSSRCHTTNHHRSTSDLATNPYRHPSGSFSSIMSWRTPAERIDVLRRLASEERRALKSFDDRRKQLLHPTSDLSVAQAEGDPGSSKSHEDESNGVENASLPQSRRPSVNTTIVLDVSLLVSLMKLLEAVYYDGIEMPSVPLTHLQEELHAAACSSSSSSRRSYGTTLVHGPSVACRGPPILKPDFASTTTNSKPTSSSVKLLHTDGVACSTQFLLSLFQLSLDVARQRDHRLIAVNACSSILSYWSDAEDTLRRIRLGAGEVETESSLRGSNGPWLSDPDDNDDVGLDERAALGLALHHQSLLVEEAVQASFLDFAAEAAATHGGGEIKEEEGGQNTKKSTEQTIAVKPPFPTSDNNARCLRHEYEVHLRSVLEAFQIADIVSLFSLTARRQLMGNALHEKKETLVVGGDTHTLPLVSGGGGGGLKDEAMNRQHIDLSSVPQFSLPGNRINTSGDDTSSTNLITGSGDPIPPTASMKPYTQALTVLLDVLCSDHLPSMRSQDILHSACVALALHRHQHEGKAFHGHGPHYPHRAQPRGKKDEEKEMYADDGRGPGLSGRGKTMPTASENLSLSRELRRYLSAIPVLCANDVERFELSDLVLLWTHLFLPFRMNALPPSPPSAPSSTASFPSLRELVLSESFVSAEAARSLADHLIVHQGLEETLSYQQLEQYREALHAARSAPQTGGTVDPVHRTTLLQFGFLEEAEPAREDATPLVRRSVADDDPWRVLWERLLLAVRPTVSEHPLFQQHERGLSAFWLSEWYKEVDAMMANPPAFSSTAATTVAVAVPSSSGRMKPLASTLPVSTKKSRKTVVGDDSRSQFMYFLRLLVLMEVVLTPET